AWDPEKEKTVVAVIPTRREGVVVQDDWDNMGQRQTDSGSVEFRGVEVYEDEILSSPGPQGTPFASLRTCLTQMILANLFVGMAAGALQEAKAYTRSHTRTWRNGAEKATDDPYILHHYGTMWVSLESALCLAERAAESLERAWRRQEALTAEERGECAVTVAAAKVAASRAALDITSGIFDVMGSGATASRFRYDRFWRNVRTMTLHDPVDYKIYEVGQWVLNGRLPTPGFYS
ncbi:MAG: acyl-CoA dehydrogenase family protein, partial [Kyrpidia sp.]|nr:acyl-CoA dehydrogenase family protein [Kyrpidia sp.]